MTGHVDSNGEPVLSTVNATHRKRLARALAAHLGVGYLTALDQVTKAATAGRLPARLDEAGLAAALRILTNSSPDALAATPIAGQQPRLASMATIAQAIDSLPDRRIAADSRDQQIFDLSAVYEAWTGKQGLMYISSPGGGKDRYVFGSASGGGHVCLGREEALAHITTMVNNSTPPTDPAQDAPAITRPTEDAQTSEDRYHLEKSYLLLLRQVWQGRVTLEVDRVQEPRTALTHFALDNTKVGAKQEIELSWLLHNGYIDTVPLTRGDEWARVRTTEFGDEVLTFHGADTDKFASGLPDQNRRTGTRINVIKRSDIARCPISSLSAEHYNADGSCKCVNPAPSRASTRPAELDPAVDRLMGGPTTTKVYDNRNRRVNATCDVCNRRLKTGESWWMVHSPNRNWEGNAGVVCAKHEPQRLPLFTAGDATPTTTPTVYEHTEEQYEAARAAGHKAFDPRTYADNVARRAAETVHAARPNPDHTHCAVCLQRIRKVAGGRGPTWVHAESGAVAAAGGDPEHPLNQP